MTGICFGGDETSAGFRAGVWGKIYGSARGVCSCMEGVWGSVWGDNDFTPVKNVGL
ncbi:hypothetical protein [Bartonella florencae]|uniref:hypothetical protein n=1 Tax=Bartonella florencae TaxID=928210 RepID=UPI0003068122|nr:hypothetical protein [Bartonella florencae]